MGPWRGAQGGDDPVEPDAVEEREGKAGGRGELEDDDPATGPDDPPQLGEPAVEIGEVARAEADGGGVEGVLGVDELQGIAPLEADDDTGGDGAVPCGLDPGPGEHSLGEVAADDVPPGGDAPGELEREVPGPGGDVEDAVAGADLGEVGGALAPAVVQPGGHGGVEEVVDPGDAVEHRTCLAGLASAPCRRATSGMVHGYLSCERNSTTALNFCGGRFLKEGIGAVGLTSVRAIPLARQARADVGQLRTGAVIAVLADLVTGEAARLGDDQLAGFVLRRASSRRP